MAGITNPTLLNGCTASFTGGTSLVFAQGGEQPSKGGIRIINTDEPNPTARVSLVLTPKFPKRITTSSGMSWSKGTFQALYVLPFTDSQGNIHNVLLRQELEFHPEQTAASLLEIRKRGAQILLDSDLANFWDYGAVAP